MRRLARWFDERTGSGDILRGFFDRPLPRGIGWAHTFGSALLFLFGVQFVTGMLLAMNYVASPGSAYASVHYLQFHVPLGWLLRGIHLWTAYAIIVIVGLHLLRTFIWAAYKYPRELTWLSGAALFLVVIVFSFTGYLLPWDQKAYWATDVGTNIAGSVPILGNAILRFLRGGTVLGPATLARFYAFHVLILPALLVLLVTFHVFLVIRHGIAAPPRQRPLLQPRPDESLPAWYQREYAEEKRRGKPFYQALLKDGVVAAGLLTVILVLAIWQGAPIGKAANPNGIQFVPRPDWYFLDAFQLLRYIKGNLEPIGTFVLPLLFFVLLVLLPFADRRRERNPHHRPVPVTVGAVIVVAALALTYLGATQPAPAAAQAIPVSTSNLNATQAAGAKLFSTVGCLNCHTFGNTGGTTGPNLTHIGGEISEAQIVQTVTHGRGPMPSFKSLGAAQINEIAAFLSSQK